MVSGSFIGLTVCHHDGRESVQIYFLDKEEICLNHAATREATG